MAIFPGRMPSPQAGVSLPAADIAVLRLGVKDIQFVAENTSGVSGFGMHPASGVAGDTTKLISFSELDDTGITGVWLASGKSLYFRADMPYTWDVTQSIGFQLLYTTNAAAADLTGSTSANSGKHKFALDGVRRLSVASFHSGSGAAFTGTAASAYVTFTSNGTDFTSGGWSGTTTASGVHGLLCVQGASISGYISGSGANGTNFAKGDTLIIGVSKPWFDSTSGHSGFIVGLNVFYYRDHL